MRLRRAVLLPLVCVTACGSSGGKATAPTSRAASSSSTATGATTSTTPPSRHRITVKVSHPDAIISPTGEVVAVVTVTVVNHSPEKVAVGSHHTELQLGCPKQQTDLNTGYPPDLSWLGFTIGEKSVERGATQTRVSSPIYVPKPVPRCPDGSEAKLFLGLTQTYFQGEVAGTVNFPSYGYDLLVLPYDVGKLVADAHPPRK